MNLFRISKNYAGIRAEGGRFPRAALKSGDRSDQVAKDQIHAAVHFFQEGGTGAVPGVVLTLGPSSIFALDRAAKNAQHGGGDGVADPATVFAPAHIQAVIRAIFNAPVLPGQFKQALGGGLRWR